LRNQVKHAARIQWHILIFPKRDIVNHGCWFLKSYTTL
jgi:hypothetical protein